MDILNSLKKYFYNIGTSAATATSKIPIIGADGNPAGCDSMEHIAQVTTLHQFWA